MSEPNAELAYRVLDHIDAHPEQWWQHRWIGQAECGTVACFAGWAVLLSGKATVRDEMAFLHEDGETEERHIADVAEVLLGINQPDYFQMSDPFCGLLTRQELGDRVAEIFGPRPCPNCPPGYDCGRGHYYATEPAP